MREFRREFRRRQAVLLLILAMAAWASFPARPAFGQTGDLQFANLGSCKLQSGKVIDPCRIGYRIFGTPDATRSNAVLFPTWYDGTSDDLTRYFGPYALVDTTQFFGVAIDAIGNGVSSSPSNSPAQHGAAFPQFTIQDMVDTEYRLANEVLHLKHVRAVVGISMGGMQAFEWMVRYPDFMNGVVSIVGTPLPTSYDLWNWHMIEEAIELDPDYQRGNYTTEPKLKLANELLASLFETPAYRVEHTSRQQFAQAYLAAGAPTGQDANDRLWQLRAVLQQDVTGGSSIPDAANLAKAQLLVVASEKDHEVNPAPAIAWAKASGATLYESHSDCGHNVMECDGFKIQGIVRDFLAAN